MPELGVNIDHFATLRELRHGTDPDPVIAALIAQNSGADSIVAHLREDRRHIKDSDLPLLKKIVKVKFNLEMSLACDIVEAACKIRPDQATLVPERRQELTTEGGLDVSGGFKKVKTAIRLLEKRGIAVSLFIDPQRNQIRAAYESEARIIELHTGHYADAKTKSEKNKRFLEIESAAGLANEYGLTVNAGHGLNYFNVGPVAKIKWIKELNIGYSIVCRAAFIGLGQAIKEMKELTR